jgi:hypothetical protein
MILLEVFLSKCVFEVFEICSSRHVLVTERAVPID